MITIRKLHEESNYYACFLVCRKYLQHDRFDDKLTNKLLKYEGKFEHLVHKLGGEKMDKFFHRHFDPISMYLSFKVIKDQYGPAVGVCQQITDAIHYRTISTKNLVPVYDMSFAFNCPNTLEGFHTICKAITKVVELVQKYAIDGKLSKDACYIIPLIVRLDFEKVTSTDVIA